MKYILGGVFFNLDFFLELVTTGEDPDFKFEVKEPEYVTLDGNNVTAQKIGETTVSRDFFLPTAFYVKST